MLPGTDAETADAILAAATKVFATEATRQITLKRVALEARVPSDTVTERWASTSDLLAEVYGVLADGIAQLCPPGRALRHAGDLDAEQDALLESMVQIVVRSSLDGFDLAQLVERFPNIERMIEQRTSEGLDEVTARHRVFQVLLLEFGYRVFADLLLAACGLADEPEGRARAEINALELRIATLPPVPSEV
jgi:AcrR family transcriptional regulator